MPDDIDSEAMRGGRSFWSGAIAFGLVSIPVSLYGANRRHAASLRMLDEDGTPLARRYFCTQEGVPLSRDDLVRGYEIERDKFIVVSDEELDALVPEKSREIDLRRFVPLNQIDPMSFERAYFLAPNEGAIKAYRLLTKSMESMGRAGIATVVMRGKEYLVAIIAERGVLRAETLRFHDELRTPEAVGLPALETTTAEEMRAIMGEIDSLATDQLDSSELTDEENRRLLELVERKLESHEGVVHAPEVPESESAEIIDLMQVLKESLAAKVRTETERPGPAQTPAQPKKRASHTGDNSGKGKGKGGNGSNGKAGKHSASPKMSKAELYERAKALDLPGRSHMSKEELLRAVQEQAR